MAEASVPNPAFPTPAAPHPAVNARRAEAIGAHLPPLIVAADRIAATVAQGVHGRRRVGQGDSFWQFRPFVAGDTTQRIDWRQSAKSSRAFVRETEWEAAQTVYLWSAAAPSMNWRSGPALPTKATRASLLLLALAALLLRGGERAALLAADAPRPVAGRAGLDRLAETLGRQTSGTALPLGLSAPRHARAVLIGDFLSPLADIRAAVAALAAIPVTGTIVQVLDPAEIDLPYAGRVRFTGLGQEPETLIPRVEAVRDAYASRLHAQIEGLAAICSAAGWTCTLHRTDNAPEAALLGLYTALAPQAGRR